MSTSKKPLKPDDFPVTAEGRKIKSRTASPSPILRIQISLLTWPSALMTTKPGAKRISGQPDRRSLAVEQRTDKLQQGLVLWAAGPISQEFADIRVGYLSA
jgi:hypothetical protein